MKKILSLILLLLVQSVTLKAQFINAEVSVTGLTCPQCSRSVEKSIKNLSFVKDVKMDLESAVATIYFNKDQFVDLKKVAGAVKDAGFSVSNLKATFNFNNVPVDNKTVVQESYSFYLIRMENLSLNGETVLLFIDPAFMDKKTWEIWKEFVPPVKEKSENMYFVSL